MTTYTKKLNQVTFSVHHNPSCVDPFQVRLVGKGAGVLDNKQSGPTRDAVGFGKSLEDAAKMAWHKRHDQ